jgi:3-hydroxyisobutyrate dehydrogenase-like beta-hydroxyacid dehydrogenase
MGLPMVRRLHAAGWGTVAVDRDDDRLRAAEPFATALPLAEAVERCPIICTSLPSSSSFVQLVEEDLLQKLRSGQWLVDFGTVAPPETRRLSALLNERGVHAVDAPVSGGPWGVNQGTLRVFFGASAEDAAAIRPLLETVAGTNGLVTHCGPPGAGQIVKGVNQLMMGLGAAAYLEALAFGVRAGVDAEVLAKAVGGDGRWRADLGAVARQIAEGKGLEVGTKFRELPYFLAEAEATGAQLPITACLWNLLAEAPRVTVDDHRDAPSFWHELLRQGDQPS